MTSYEPRGGARELLLARDNVVLISGAAGTGKSLAASYKTMLTALLVPGSRQLIVRQTNVSLAASTLVTFERQVITELLRSGDVKWYGGSASKPPAYLFRNGSEILVGGLDKPDKLLSTEYDRIFVDEATDVSETAVQVLTTRLRGKAPTYKQLVLSCNPSHPDHHLHRMAMDGRARHIVSLHRDNPYLMDASGTLTAAGTEYMGFLEGLTGTRRERFLYGRWAAAEGLVYDAFSQVDHVVDSTPAIQRIFNTVDWGYQNALVWQEWGVCADGRAYLLREISKKNWLVEDFARHCREHLWRNADNRLTLPEAVVVDHDAEDRATFERHARFPTLPARKAVSQGVQAVQNRMRIDATGRPGLFVVRDSLMGRDPVAQARRTPRGVLAEITGYVWATERGADGIPKEAPLKQNDHSMDALRYAVMYLDGAPPARAGNPAKGSQSATTDGRWGRRVSGKR